MAFLLLLYCILIAANNKENTAGRKCNAKRRKRIQKACALGNDRPQTASCPFRTHGKPDTKLIEARTAKAVRALSALFYKNLSNPCPTHSIDNISL